MIKYVGSILIFISSILSADVFDRGSASVGLVAGGSYYNGEYYNVVGIDIDHFVGDGLCVGAGYYGSFGANSTLNQLTLRGSYYIPLSRKLRPYIGGFMRETFVNSEDNYESYGVRGGLAIVMSPNSYMSFGYVYEEYSNCILSDCSNSYSELVFAFSF